MEGRAGDALETVEGEPEAESSTESIAASYVEHVPASPAEVLLTGPMRRASSAPTAGVIPGVVRATIVGASEDGRPLVTWPGAPSAKATAEAVWISDAPQWSDCAGLAAVVGFEDGDPARPLLLGLLGKPPVAAPVAVAPDAAADLASPEGAAAGTLPDAPRSVRIESGEELILQCGEAKIVLRADGSVTILGGKVVTRARGVNKIKGGSVQIN